MRFITFFVLMAVFGLFVGCAATVSDSVPIVPSEEGTRSSIEPPTDAEPTVESDDGDASISSEEWARQVWEGLDRSCAGLVVTAGIVDQCAAQAEVDRSGPWDSGMRSMRFEISSWIWSVERLRRATDHRERWLDLIELQNSTADLEQTMQRLEELVDTVDVDDLSQDYAQLLNSLEQLRSMVERARGAVTQATLRYSTVIDI